MEFNNRDGEKSGKLEKHIEDFKRMKDQTLIDKIVKGIKFFLIIDVEGSLLPVYQRRHARQLGWPDKDMTIRNAVYCGILPALGYAILNQHFGDNVGETFQKLFYSYPGLMFYQAVIRAPLAQVTGEPIPSIGILPLFGNLGYFLADTIKKYGSKKSSEAETCEGS